MLRLYSISNYGIMVFKMEWRNILEISDGVYWVGVKDWDRRLFDSLIPLPKGTSYNAYLVIGDNWKVLVDTVNPGFEAELHSRISRIIDPEEIDYIVMNHAEPDHAGAIPYLMRINDKAKLVTTPRGAKMAQTYYSVDEKRIVTVTDQERISIGGKTLRFIEAPMLHWPETMFTYLEEDGILFSCDFFGSHLAAGFFDDEVEDLLVHAQRYWGEIMMPFRSMGGKALEKIKDLNIRVIAPSHGPIHRNIRRILDAYQGWVRGDTKSKASIIYVSMWRHTESMIQLAAETLMAEGVNVAIYNLTVSDIGDLVKDLVDSRAIVIGAPTVLGGAHPLAVYASYLIKALRPPLRYMLLLSSYGWGGGAIRHLRGILEGTGSEIVGSIEVNGPPSADDMNRIIELSRTLAQKIKGGE